MAISKKNSAGGPLGMLIQHAEKIILSCIALSVLVVLGMTSWSPFSKDPLELINKIKTANEEIEKSVIPEDKLKSYRELHADDTRRKVQQSFNNLALAGRNFNPPFWVIITSQDGEPIREPQLAVVENLIATPGKAALTQLRELPALILENNDTEENKTSENANQPNLSDDVAPRNNTTGVPGAANNQPGQIPLDANGNPLNEDKISSLTNTQIVSNLEVVPVSFIAVRAIIPRQKQIKYIAEALHTKPEIAEQYLQYLDFVLERQESVQGTNQWTTPWEEVNKQVAIDYLQKSPDWEADFISAAVYDPVLTMPLLWRWYGNWKNYADHPGIRDFALTPEEMKLEAQLNLKALEAMRETSTRNRTKTQKTPGGFWQIQRGTRQIQEQYLNTTPTDTLLQEFEKELARYDNDAQKAIIERIKKRVSAEGNLLLFRYFDFDVKPGKTYRYRVKLQMANPNFGLSSEYAEKFTVVEGETRDTPWSTPSEPATVDKDSYYFVKRIDLPRNNLEPKATFNVVEVNPQSGTLVSADIEVPAGDYIKANKKTYIIRPDKGTFEEEEVEFSSDNLLLDIKGIGKVDPTFHKELSFPNKFYGDIQAPSMTLVLTDTGNLEAKHQISDYQDLKRITEKKDRQDKAWEHIKGNAAEAVSSSTDGSSTPEGEFGGNSVVEQLGNADRQGNVQRKAFKSKQKVAAPLSPP